MTDKIDSELNLLIGRLSKVQKKVGGPEKAQIERVLGEDGKVDAFQDVKQQLKRRIENMHQLLDEVHTLKEEGQGKELITAQSKARSALIEIQEQFKVLEGIYNSEAKKKRSKYTKDEMEIRYSELGVLRRNIENIKEAQRSGYVGTKEGYRKVELVDMKDSELFNPQKAGAAGGANKMPQEEISGQQKQQMSQIQKRDADIDNAVVALGRNVDVLKDLAMVQNQEIKLQDKMLDQLDGKMEEVGERVLSVNGRLKETLVQARGSDKVCMVRLMFDVSWPFDD